MEDQKKDFFISYTGKDSKWAEWIAWQLEAAKFTLIIQAWDSVAGAGSLPKTLAAAVTDELAFDKIAAAFRRYSLVEVNAEQNSFTVHRLVQAVMNSRMTGKKSAKLAEAAAQLVNGAFPGGEFYQQPATWPLCGELLLHALSVTERAEAIKVANELTANLLNRLGVYLRVLARYAEAKGLLERALAIDEASFGPDHRRVANRVNNLALVLKELGDFAQARKLCERALAIDEASFGSDHPNVAIRVNNLAGVFQDLGDLAQARTLFERALAIFRKVLGDDHPNTRTVRKNLETLIEEMSDEG